MPVSLLLYSLGAWTLGANLGWAGRFFIASGPFTHWMTWIAIAMATHLISRNGGQCEAVKNSAPHHETIAVFESPYAVNNGSDYGRMAEAGQRLSRSR